MPKRIVIVGATSAIAEHCARTWLQREAVDLVLIGRNKEKLETIAADLRVRKPNADISTLVADFENTQSISNTLENISSSAPVDIGVIAHGLLPDQTGCQNDLDSCRHALDINAISPALFAEAFAAYFEKHNHGTLAIISSVAGDRARRSNYVYGSAKSMLSSYADGLRHRFAGTAVKIVLIKPGPTETPMTAHLEKNRSRLAPVEVVAKAIVHAVDAGKPVAYVPAKWALVMLIIRNLPWMIFKKMDI